MLSANILRRLRPCIVSQSFSNFDRTAVRHGTKVTASFFTIAKSVKQPHAVRRSLLNTNTKLQWFCPSTRCLTAETHSTDQSLIYTGSLGTAVRGVKLFSYSTSGASLFLMPTILMTSGVQSLVMQAAFCGIIGFFTFLTPVLLHFVTKGYVVRLYHQPHTDSYTAITYSVFLTEKKTVFTQGQVRIPAVSKMFTTFYANKLGLLVNPDLFPIPQDYNHLMGYDKPFSFDTDNMNTPDKS